MTHGPRKKPLHSGGNSYQVTLKLHGRMHLFRCLLVLTVLRHQRPRRGMRPSECHSRLYCVLLPRLAYSMLLLKQWT